MPHEVFRTEGGSDQFPRSPGIPVGELAGVLTPASFQQGMVPVSIASRMSMGNMRPPQVFPAIAGSPTMWTKTIGKVLEIKYEGSWETTKSTATGNTVLKATGTGKVIVIFDDKDKTEQAHDVSSGATVEIAGGVYIIKLS